MNAVPSCGNSFAMNTILRGEFNFSGMVVSDCGAIGDAAFSSYVKKHFGGDPRQQARLGVQAGCDLNARPDNMRPCSLLAARCSPLPLAACCVLPVVCYDLLLCCSRLGDMCACMPPTTVWRLLHGARE